MLNFLKQVGTLLLGILVFCLALGMGAVLTALSSIIGLVVIGGVALMIIILIIREILGANG